MTTMAFDTLQFAKKLIGAGVPQHQAEVQAEAIAELVQEKLATKTDLKELETNLKFDTANLKVELIRWVLGISAAQAAIIIACIKFIH